MSRDSGIGGAGEALASEVRRDRGPATGTAAPPFVGRGGRRRASAARRLLPSPDGNPALNRLAELAAQLLGARSAQVSVLADLQHVVAGSGLRPHVVGSQGPLEDSLCTVTVGGGAPLVVSDAAADGRVAMLPPVTSGEVSSYLGVPLIADDGHAVGVLCVFDREPREWSEHDVALLQRLAAPVVAELELAALTADYETDRLIWQLAVDSAGVGAFDWDLTTGELHWDDRLLELFGLERSTFEGTIDAFNDVVHPDDLPRVTAALEDAIASCGAYTAEYRVLVPGGGVRWVTARGRALCGDGGRPVRVLGAAYDTTAVQEGEARVARLLEAMPTAFFHLDLQWRFRYLNAEGERLLGTPRAELVGQELWTAFPAAVGSEIETHYRRAMSTGEAASFDAYYPQPLDAWYEVRAWPSPDGLSVFFVDISARRAAQDQVELAARRSSLLARLTTELNRNLNAEEGVARFASLVVPELADWSVVTLVDDLDPVDWRRQVRDVGWWHADRRKRGLVGRYARARIAALTDESLVARALRTGESVVIADGARDAVSAVLVPGESRDLLAELDPSAVAVVPLQGRGRINGVLTVFRGGLREPFSAWDLETLHEAAQRAGLALDNARLFAQQRDLAETLQRSLLTAPPEPDHVEIAVRYEPAARAAQVGGDWYDSFLQSDGTTNVVIGDVVGHDTAAAAAMGQVRGLLRAIAVHTGGSPSEVLRGVDQALETLQVETTATAVVARFEQTDEERAAGETRMRWSNAGHPPPLLLRPDGSSQVVGDLDPDLLLGLDPAARRNEATVRLDRSTTVLFYTDGLVERRGQSLDDGLRELRSALSEVGSLDLPLEELCDRLLDRLLPERPEDDVALVAVRLHREDRPRPPEAGPNR